MNTNEIIEHRIKILQAWNTQEVQYRVPDEFIIDGGKWYKGNQQIPNFEKYEYRIKPTPHYYKVGLFKENDFYYTMVFGRNDEQETKILEQKPDFVKWLTDWVEYGID